jgi:general stress protein CsbA
MVLAADYPFLNIFWTMIIFFAWVAWIWMLILILTDIFRRRDISGWAKAAWTVFVIVVPFLAALIYLIAQHDGMRERSLRQAEDQQAALDQYVRQTAGGSAAEIAKAKELLDAGTITQADFDAIKAKALS